MIIISGIPAGPGGVGALMGYLEKQRAEITSESVRIISGCPLLGSLLRERKHRAFARSVMRFARTRLTLASVLHDKSVTDTEEPVVLIHPQTLGYWWCKRFFRARRFPTWLYVVDSSFFCKRSYNYIPGEMGPCLRCVGGNWQHAKSYACPSRPVYNVSAVELMTEIKYRVERGEVRLLAMNQTQAALLRRHFGSGEEIPVVGLWTADWPRELTDTRHGESRAYDVVIHGMAIPAKGHRWAVELARRCPNLRFLFPSPWDRLFGARGSPPPNCDFRSITWDTGLADAVRKARLVLHPSLWSAPIEGALIKSLMVTPAVGVVENPSAFCSELPEDLVLRLPFDIAEAAKIVSDAIQKGWHAPADLRRTWAADFCKRNEHVLSQINAACLTGHGRRINTPERSTARAGVVGLKTLKQDLE